MDQWTENTITIFKNTEDHLIMTESTINYDIDFDIMNYYRSTDTATKILGSYLDRIKEHTGDSWDKIALDLSTTRKTIKPIQNKLIKKAKSQARNELTGLPSALSELSFWY